MTESVKSKMIDLRAQLEQTAALAITISEESLQGDPARESPCELGASIRATSEIRALVSTSMDILDDQESLLIIEGMSKVVENLLMARQIVTHCVQLVDQSDEGTSFSV